MASIQQSMNQLLGAVAGASTAGAYLYRQTPSYKARQYDKEAKAGQAIIESGQSEFYENNADFYEAQSRQAGDVLRATESAYKTKPSEARHEAYIKATKEYSDRLQEQREYTAEAEQRAQAQVQAQDQAEQNALARLEARSEKRRGMIEGVWQRKDIVRNNEWQRGLAQSMDTPGDASRDRLKMATITRDVKFKERHKGETE